MAIDNAKGKTHRIDNNGKSDFTTIGKSDLLTAQFQQRAFFFTPNNKGELFLIKD